MEGFLNWSHFSISLWSNQKIVAVSILPLIRMALNLQKDLSLSPLNGSRISLFYSSFPPFN
jgi:hypothetical protein